MVKLSLAIFDLDGVLVDTAGYHYKAWNRLTEEILGFYLSEEAYEQLKGVSRSACMEIIENLAKRRFTEEEKDCYAAMKNNWYLEYIDQLTRKELLAGAEEILIYLRKHNIKTALGSASKNAGKILEKLRLRDQFDLIVDGNMVSRAKPDPEVFLRASEELKVNPEECIVFEDSYAGIEAAHAGGMYGCGIGRWKDLSNADLVTPDLAHVPVKLLFS